MTSTAYFRSDRSPCPASRALSVKKNAEYLTRDTLREMILKKCRTLKALGFSLALPCFSGLIALPAGAQEGSVLRFRSPSVGFQLRAEIWSDSIVHFEYSTANTDQIWTSPMIAPGARAETASTRRHSLRILGPWSFTTTRVRVEVNPLSLCVSSHEATGSQRLLQTLCPQRFDPNWKTISISSPSTTQAYGLGQNFTRPGQSDGDLLGRIWDPGMQHPGNYLRGFHGGANSFITFPILYALGAQRHNYAILLDSIHKQMWSLDAHPWQLGTASDAIRWFLIAGDSLADLRKDYLALSGRPPVPPKSVFGLWVGEFGYTSFNEVQERLDELKQAQMPVDGFMLDLQWFGATFYNRGDDVSGSRFGTLRFDSESTPHRAAPFAAPAARIEGFRQQGVQVMPIEESYISKYLPEHTALAREGYLARQCPFGAPTELTANPWWGIGGMLDWSNPAAGAYWHTTKRKPLTDLGITHHWLDLGEPEMYDNNSCYYGIPELNLHRQADVHNIYNLKWAQSIAEGYRTQSADKRPFLMARAGTSGIQRYGAGLWSGDIAANFGALTAHFNAQMHMSLAGVDYYGSDTGGFHRRPDTLSMDGPYYNQDELYTQWLANSALFDFPVRPHVWNLAKNLHTSPAKIGDFNSNLFNVRLRYQLIPYYYSLAHQAARTGEPVVPPMIYHFQDDPRVAGIAHQKMIGPWLMAGVVAHYGETERNVYLPKGQWYNFHTLQTYNSNGSTFRLAAKESGIFRLPLVARAGAIIPMAHVDANTANAFGKSRRPGAPDENRLRLRVFPSREPSQFSYYDDDGHTQDYLRGNYTAIDIRQQVVHNRSGGEQLEVTLRSVHLSTPGESTLRRSVTVEILTSQRAVLGVRRGSQTMRECSTTVTAPCYAVDPAGLVHIHDTLANAMKLPYAVELL
jgi:alpha-glucosidase (family GH31 glycosyl hydrolase)